jgi:hypothetical protein
LPNTFRKGKRHQIRAFVNVNAGESREYTSISVAMKNPDLRQQVLNAAVEEMRAWRERYSELSELAEVLSAIDSTLGDFELKASA